MNPHQASGEAIRRADPAALADALIASRRDTLVLHAAWEQALADGRTVVPCDPGFNPPRWELGHVGWFQTFWIARNPQRQRGLCADPDAPRAVSDPTDAWYDSGRVPHATRWSLPLPGAHQVRAALAAQLDATLEQLRRAPADDTGLYFFRLAVLHEDMHHEAGLWMAQALGLPIDDARWRPAALAGERAALTIEPGTGVQGHAEPGFAFDNELAAQAVSLPAYAIDARVLTWAEYLPFVEAGGYAQPRWWSEAGWAWLARARSERPAAPRYLRRDGIDWSQWRGGRWQPLDPAEPACHLNAHEAQAWCTWAGRRLPTEAEWERAARTRPEDFHWGAVWEWTASSFAPYAGFVAHPYRDYSAPWFGGHRVLRGGSWATSPRLHHRAYRNFFVAERCDVFAGFRSCAR